ncbi:MAG TPA: uroporphyrinogen decarboxylase family protein [Bacteroidales bacterium]|nr:uroporphyrinogen decarboxylase family protein [Bacteroidales bacterium]
MTSKEIILAALDHKETGRIPVDFGSTSVTGIHVRAVENLRNYYGLEKKPVKVIEPFQMLGEIDEDLAEILGTDVIGLTSRKNMFGIPQDEGWKEFRTFWGQVVLLPEKFNTTFDEDGALLIYPEGDTSVPPCAKMPKAGYFFDAIIRQEPIDENNLNVEDNLEEFSLIQEEDIAWWKKQFDLARKSNKAVVANFGGTAIGDIALVPGLNLKCPKGIRDVAEWYISTVARQDYLHKIFEKQTDIALQNLSKLQKAGGDAVDVVFICGTDFGTQTSTFCSGEVFDRLYAPYYKKMNDWIHSNTRWKTFKHSCGAVEPFIRKFIECGFDILNPVQINAAGMNPVQLKKKYGKDIVFWGGGVDTQKVLAFGTPQDVRRQVIENCRIFGEGGGFVFNTVHNIQANVPVENIVSMVETLKELNS